MLKSDFLPCLKKHLAEHKDKFATKEYAPGGCDTCGFNEETIEVLDFTELLRQIDSFAETFIKSG